jgi:hypothetical protein
MERADNNQAVSAGATASDIRDTLRQGLLGEIRDLRRFSNRGLWALSLFLVVSTLAWRNFPFLPRPGQIVAALGPPPTSQIISLVLILYTFSAIILSLCRMMANMRHRSSFCHVGYLSVFYFFYYLADGLADNYLAVFGAGFTILCMESYRIWTFCNDNILKKNEQLAYLERTGRLPLEDSPHESY